LEYLKKALEKARAIKQETEEVETSRTSEVSPSESPSLLRTSQATVGEIHYAHTRTMPVSADWLRSMKIVTGAADDPAEEDYKLIRTQIVQRTKADNKNLLMVTGPLPGEGKTLTAINVAISLAQEKDKTVLLVDADLRRPAVHEYLGLSRTPGLVEYLTDKQTLPELLVHPEDIPKLVVLPGGRPIREAAELISSPLMVDLVEELKHFYPDRYVLFDLPPMLTFTDALAFAPLVDGIILVVERGKTPRDDIQRCLKMIEDFPLLGLVFNKVEGKGEVYHNYYKYYNYYRNNGGPAQKKRWLEWLRK
jgi:protein-tyrosine kinase